MIDDEKLAVVTREVKKIMETPEYCYPTNDEYENYDIMYTLRSHIASLHNLLYEQVTGKRYDYMAHWCNKIGVWVDDDVYYEVLEQEE